MRQHIDPRVVLNNPLGHQRQHVEQGRRAQRPLSHHQTVCFSLLQNQTFREFTEVD